MDLDVDVAMARARISCVRQHGKEDAVGGGGGVAPAGWLQRGGSSGVVACTRVAVPGKPACAARVARWLGESVFAPPRIGLLLRRW